MNSTQQLDIVMVSDFRFPGGTSGSVAEEIRAQAAAGYRVGLVQVFGPLVREGRRFSPMIRRCIDQGLAELIAPRQPVRAKLAILRHPAVFEARPEPMPALSVDTAVLVANQPAADSAGEIHYDVPRVTETVRELLGVEPLWAPIGPLVRPSLEPHRNELTVRAEDWLNIIDVDDWAAPRRQYVDTRPVIGRHSRPQPSKWPDNRHDMLAAYPDTGEFRVRILGGAAAATSVLGTIPRQWAVEEFDSRHPRDFLAGLDFFVYYHHPAWVEAYGRTIMEALASGAVAVLPPHFQPVFGDAAVYGTPAEAGAIVRRLYDDRAAYEAQSKRGTEFVRARHGHKAHVQRITQLIGPPHTQATNTGMPRPRVRSSRDRVLFVSSNGAGMGHLSRLLAMARRSSEHVEPVFFSMSQAVPVVATEGYPFEYCPSRGDLDTSSREWNPFFAKRFLDVLARYKPRAIVFDGTWPYNGLIEARDLAPGVAFVWSRRAMWKPEASADQLDKAQYFDLVIEPGEFAEPADRGPTTRATDAHRVRPVTVLDQEELLPREQAMRELGLDPTRPATLVTLGAGNINDITSDVGILVEALRNRDERQICLTQPSIAGNGHGQDHQVHRLAVYPLSRYANAFDLAVSAAGYNSFHESIAFGIPTAFVPNLSTAIDDQGSRARYAEQAGTGLYLPAVTSCGVADALHVMEHPQQQRAMIDQCREQYPGNGAAEAMRAVENLLGDRQGALAAGGKR